MKTAVELAGFLRREDEKLEAAQVLRIIAIAPVHHSRATVDGRKMPGRGILNPPRKMTWVFRRGYAFSHGQNVKV